MTALYIHIPWCIKKCPYCDFNSHQKNGDLPEKAYIERLIADFNADLASFPTHLPIQSIFIGGGTPSLFSAEAYVQLFAGLKQALSFAHDIEITLEANPGTVEQTRFNDYRQLGINRLSLGIQSFDIKALKRLGRIHDDKQAHRAIATARKAGFDNINLDIMHGLPEQTMAQGLADLEQALSYDPEHLSWYQLTIEPNTLFYKKTPKLPEEHQLEMLETSGLALLEAHNLNRYEISAFAKPQKAAVHNVNYWLFGDYFGIGAGAHGKLSTQTEIYRTRKPKQPQSYLNATTLLPYHTKLSTADKVFEFMLNATRLNQPIAHQLFNERTKLPFSELKPKLEVAAAQHFIDLSDTHWQVTSHGRRYTNDLQALFLSD